MGLQKRARIQNAGVPLMARRTTILKNLRPIILPHHHHRRPAATMPVSKEAAQISSLRIVRPLCVSVVASVVDNYCPAQVHVLVRSILVAWTKTPLCSNGHSLPCVSDGNVPSANAWSTHACTAICWEMTTSISFPVRCKDVVSMLTDGMSTR